MSTKTRISQYRIAKLSGLSQAAISLILSGKRIPRPATARRLEAATGVAIEIWRSGDSERIRRAWYTIPPPKGHTLP